MTHRIELGNIGGGRIFRRAVIQGIHDRLRVGDVFHAEAMAEFVRDHAMKPKRGSTAPMR